MPTPDLGLVSQRFRGREKVGVGPKEIIIIGIISDDGDPNLLENPNYHRKLQDFHVRP